MSQALLLFLMMPVIRRWRNSCVHSPPNSLPLIPSAEENQVPPAIIVRLAMLGEEAQQILASSVLPERKRLLAVATSLRDALRAAQTYTNHFAPVRV